MNCKIFTYLLNKTNNVRESVIVYIPRKSSEERFSMLIEDLEVINTFTTKRSTVIFGCCGGNLKGKKGLAGKGYSVWIDLKGGTGYIPSPVRGRSASVSDLKRVPYTRRILYWLPSDHGWK